MKVTKMPLFFTDQRKIECSGPELVTCAGWEVKLLFEHILHGVYSALDTLFPSLLLRVHCGQVVWMQMQCATGYVLYTAQIIS